MAADLVLVDFSNFVYACWFPALSANKADPKYNPKEVLKTNLAGKLGTLTRTLHEAGCEDYDILFVEDRRSKRKYDLWPDYKAKRKPMDFDPRPLAKDFVWDKLGYKEQFCYSPDNEADDAVATLANRYTKMTMNGDVFIASSDKDLWQLKSERIHIWQLTKDKFVTPDMIEEEFGVMQVSQIPMVKALWGDSGDNVPNACPRMQKALMPGVLDTVGEPDDFFAWFDNFGIKPKDAEKLAKAEAQIRLNYQLVKLDTNCAIVFPKDYCKNTGEDHYWKTDCSYGPEFCGTCGIGKP